MQVICLTPRYEQSGMTSVLILQNHIREYRKPLYNGLAERYEVVVLHSGPPSLNEGDRYREVITPQKLMWRFHLQPNSPLGKMIGNFDAVIAMFDIAWPTYLAPLFWRRRPKYILWGHWYSTNQFANLVRNHLMKRADRLLMYGGEEIERMVKHGIDPGKIVVSPNTVHIPNAKDFSREPKSSLLFIGRLQAGSRRNSKRADILIESFARLLGKIKDDIELDIVGGGEEEGALKQLVVELGVADKVYFHGHIEDSEILSRLFSKAIALVSPGHVGLSVLQSFGHGVPVVTGKAVQYRRETQHLHNALTGCKVIMGPEYYNLRHRHNSLLVETQQELVTELEKLCNEPGYAAELGRNAYQHYVRERPLSHMLDGFRKAIEE